MIKISELYNKLGYTQSVKVIAVKRDERPLLAEVNMDETPLILNRQLRAFDEFLKDADEKYSVDAIYAKVDQNGNPYIVITVYNPKDWE